MEKEQPLEIEKEVETEEVGQNEEPKGETARETTERIYNELTKDEDSGNEGEEGKEEVESAEEPKEPEPTEEPKKRSKKEAELPDLDDIVPERLKAEEKELVKRLPKGLRKAVNRMVREHEAAFTRAQQQAAYAEQNAKGVLEAIQPYINEWSQRGFSAPAALAKLAAVQSMLTNPETAVKTYIQLGQEMGLDVSSIAEAHGEQVQQQANITNHPQFQALQQELNAIKSWAGQMQGQQFDQSVQSIASQLEAARQEKDSSGNWRFPELFDENFLDAVKPLVTNLTRTISGISHGDALKVAYYQQKGYSLPEAFALAGNSNQGTSRLPVAQNNQEQRAAQAAVSVRGRTNPQVSSGGLNNPPPEALKNARSTVTWALEQLRRGG